MAEKDNFTFGMASVIIIACGENRFFCESIEKGIAIWSRATD
jgi:hypothetical protein